MTDKSSFSEDKLFVSRIEDMVSFAEKRGCVYSSFLSETECEAAKRILKKISYENYCFYGVFDNADRKILCVYKEYFQPENTDFPVKLVTYTYRMGNKLTHRDFLGSLMALGIKRETVGDIVIDDGITQIAVLETINELVVSEIRKIGNVGVKSEENYPGILTKVQNFKEISGTVASLRLDAVAGHMLNLSRGKTADLIKGIGIEVNSELKNDCSYIVKSGDVFSVRGYGKFRLSEISGITKKGRIHITVLKYV